METTVVPPQSGVAFVKKIRAEMSEEKFDQGDKDLSILASTPGWKDLKMYIKNLKESLKPQIDLKSATDDDMYKSYGMRTIMYDLVSENLDKIINRVEDADEEVGKTRK